MELPLNPLPHAPTVAEFLGRLGHPVALVAKRPISGPDRITVVWPAEMDDPVDVACGLARGHHAVYVNLNPLKDEMLTMVPESRVSLRDAMIAKRTRILIDIDMAGSPKDAAREQFDAIRAEIGEPLICWDTGNGFAMAYVCDLPPTKEATRRASAYLRRLKASYSLVDINVASLSRLTRVAGTLNRNKLTGERILTQLLN